MYIFMAELTCEGDVKEDHGIGGLMRAGFSHGELDRGERGRELEGVA